MVETFYSALHWAKKAEKSAKLASELSQSTGKVIQLGFDGSFENGELVFKHAPGGVELPYDLYDDTEYEIDLAFSQTGELPNLTKMYVKNGNDKIVFVSAQHRSSTENARVADMEDVMRYDESTGYRWLFKATYKITPSGDKVFLIYPVIAKKDTSTITNCITEIPQDIKLELVDGTLTLKAGSKVYVPNGFDVNCGIYGTPSISDGIASGFSINNYLTLPRAFNPGSNPWEIVIKTTTPSSIEKSQVIFDSTNGTNVFRAVSIYFSKASKTFTYCLSGSGSAHDIADNVAGSNVLDYSTTYYVKLIFDGGSYKSYISTDGVEWILDFSISSSTNVYNAAVSRLGYFAYDTSLYYQGTIDLPNCYIKIADEIFWQGKTGVGNRIFEEIVIESDVSLKQQFDDNDLFVFVYRNYNGTMTLGTAYKGTTYSNEPDVVGDYKLHYMACYNKIFWDEPSYESTEISMPIAVVNRSAIEGYNSINQIFNGFGYIGSTVFALPNVKGLIPNGRNEDGSLRNVEYVTDKVGIQHLVNNEVGYFSLNVWSDGTVAGTNAKYDSTLNKIIGSSRGTNCFEVGQFYVSSGVITSFSPKLPFHAVDRNDSSWVAEQAMPSDKYTNLTLGATDSVYTAPANGFVYLKRTITSQGFQAIVNLDAGELTSEVRSHIGAGECERNFLPVKKGQRFMVQYDGTTTYPIFRFIYAEGEI